MCVCVFYFDGGVTGDKDSRERRMENELMIQELSYSLNNEEASPHIVYNINLFLVQRPQSQNGENKVTRFYPLKRILKNRNN